VIVDYKTDRISAEDAGRKTEHYRPQAAIYAGAMRKALELPVKEVIFFFVRPLEAVSIPGRDLSFEKPHES